MKTLLVRFFCWVAGLCPAFASGGPVILAFAEKDGMHGCLDLKGHAVVPFIYNEMGGWQEGLLAVHQGGEEVDYAWAGGKWGFCNTRGRLVIPMRFDSVMGFSEGLAQAKVDGRWGFINPQGRFVIQPQYEMVQDFYEGLAAVRVDGCWGFVDRSGKRVIEPLFDAVGWFKEGRCIVSLNRRLEGESGEAIMDEWNPDHGVIDRWGNWILGPEYANIWPFKGGRSRVEVVNPDDIYATKAGYVNLSGEWLIPPVYDELGEFSEGLAAVGFRDAHADEEVSLTGGKHWYGYIDTTGKLVIPAKYREANAFHDGVTVVYKEPRRSMGFQYSDSTGRLLNKEDWPTCAMIDKRGREVIPFGRFRWIRPVGCGGLYFAARADYVGTGIIDGQGNTVLDFKYTNLHYLGEDYFSDESSDGSEEVTVVDLEGREILRSQDFAMPASRFQHGLFDVRTERLRKSGCVDQHGRFVIPAEYDMIYDFEVVAE